MVVAVSVYGVLRGHAAKGLVDGETATKLCELWPSP